MSAAGTNAKGLPGPEMSAIWGRPDISRTSKTDANDPERTFGNFRAAAWPERRAKRFRLGSLHQQHAWTIQSASTSDQCLLNVNLQARTPCRLPAPVVGSNLAMTRNEIRVWGGAKPIL